MSESWRQAESEARRALAGHRDTESLAAATLRPITGGVSNFAWRATAPGMNRFVRLARVGTERLGADLYAERAVLELTAAAGLAPPVVRCDPDARLLVTDWIPGTDGSLGVERTDYVIDCVAASMQRLHTLEHPAGLRRVCFDEQARQLRALLPADAVPGALATHALEVFGQLDAGRVQAVACHHDVHAQNMIFDADGRLWLVDWEYAGLGDPVFDLASFACQARLAEPGVERLVHAYARAGGRVEPGRLALARWAFDYVQWLWYGTVATGEAAGSDRAEARQRATGLEIDLRERASRLLRCNNRRFENND